MLSNKQADQIRFLCIHASEFNMTIHFSVPSFEDPKKYIRIAYFPRNLAGSEVILTVTKVDFALPVESLTFTTLQQFHDYFCTK